MLLVLFIGFISYLVWTIVVKARNLGPLGLALDAYKYGCNGFSMMVD